jgi:hypothetical protein
VGAIAILIGAALVFFVLPNRARELSLKGHSREL